MRDTLWRRLSRGVRRLRSRGDWSGFVGADWADRIMTVALTDRELAKQGRSTGRWILTNSRGKIAVYLKRHYDLPRWRGWMAAILPSRGWSPAWQESRHLEWARAQGIPVPSVVATGEYIGPWGRLQSFLAVEELADMWPLHEAIPLARQALSTAEFERWKDGLIKELVRLTRELHGRRYFHKDLYLCHFFIPKKCLAGVDNWRGQVHLIDLHRLGCHGWAWRFWQTKDLAQLLYSSEIPGIDVRDRLRFWRLYEPDAGHRLGARLLRWFILMKWRRYRRHNLKAARRRLSE